jgi:ERCC4-type nuclease
MIEYRKFTDIEIKKICKNICILIDSREKKCQNVKDWCSHKNRCEYKTIKLDNGDYSFMLKAMPEFGIIQDMYFDKKIVIERKNSLDEISQNFTKSRTRFEEEMATYSGKMIIVVEDKWDNLFLGNYKSKYNRISFIASVMAFEHRYGISFRFMSKEAFPIFIYGQFYYYLRSLLKRE